MARRCVGSALIYSGRADPEWPIGERQIAGLRRVWAGLAGSAAAPPSAPALGYRGCAARCASGEAWFAYGGVATLTDAAGAIERRDDHARRFEHALLATAPAGLVPDGAAPPPI